jgi:hypothetical protein
VVLWIIYVVGVVEIGSAVVFCTLLAWDDFSYHRNRRRLVEHAAGTPDVPREGLGAVDSERKLLGVAPTAYCAACKKVVKVERDFAWGASLRKRVRCLECGRTW